jgi:integrase
MIETGGKQIAGPLAQFAVGLEEALVADGYSKQQARLLIGLASEVSHWLEAEGLRVGDLTEEVIDKFFAARKPSRWRCRAARSLRPIMAHLRSRGVGRVAVPLVTAVPALKTWPRTALPPVLPAGDARRLVTGCDPATARGLRDAAIVLVLLRLGLRASEVARLTLDDIDWRAGEMTIKGKGGRNDRLPLPVEVGEAIAAYLRGARPSSESRSLFLTAIAPIRPLSCDAVGTLVYRACRRADVARVGPHALRRTLATETLHAGAPMSEVAQLLRHVDQATSSIYAAADVAAVAALAQPWPEVRR